MTWCGWRRRRPNPRLAAILVALALVGPGVLASQPAAAPGDPQFADWTLVTAGVANGTLLGRSVSLSGTHISPAGSTVDGSATWFAPSPFTPQLPTSDAISIYGYEASSHTYTLAFDAPVKDPVLHVASLASTLAFPVGTLVTKVSGESNFTVAGSSVTGALDGDGDANGTIRLTGTFTSVPFTATRVYPDPSQDGIYIHVGAPTPAPPETTIVLNPAAPGPDGSYLDSVGVRVSSVNAVPGRPVEVRCALDLFGLPDEFDDLPAGCPYLSEGAVTAVGVHVLYAAGRDPSGSSGPVVGRIFSVSTTPPDTVITDGPIGGIWETHARFAFASTIPGSTFECRMDGSPWFRCTSPYDTGPLSENIHGIEMRAISPRGAVDPTPATRTFRVNSPQLHRLACQVLPARMVGGTRHCAIARADETCPTGTRCTLTVNGDWFDADERVDHSFHVTAGMGNPVAPSPRADSGCNTGFHGSHCFASATVHAIGDGRRIFASCGSFEFAENSFNPPKYGPDYSRRIECKAELYIERVQPLALATSGLQAQVYAPSAGLLVIIATLPRATGGASTAAAARPAKPRISTFRKTVTRAGPVTVRFKLNAAAKLRLKRQKKLPVSLRIAFTPTGGERLTRTVRITLKAAAPRRKACRPTKSGRTRVRCSGTRRR